MPISLTSAASIKGRLTTPRDGGTATFDIAIGKAQDVADGTGAAQANALYVDNFSIAASGSLDIDLSGSLTDAHGEPLVFTAVKEILIVADATNANNVIVGNGSAPFVGPFGGGTQTIIIKPGQRFGATDYSAAGWPVTATTADILKLANSGAGTAVNGTIVIVGKKA